MKLYNKWRKQRSCEEKPGHFIETMAERENLESCGCPQRISKGLKKAMKESCAARKRQAEIWEKWTILKLWLWLSWPVILICCGLRELSQNAISFVSLLWEKACYSCVKAISAKWLVRRPVWEEKPRNARSWRAGCLWNVSWSWRSSEAKSERRNRN